MESLKGSSQNNRQAALSLYMGVLQEAWNAVLLVFQFKAKDTNTTTPYLPPPCQCKLTVYDSFPKQVTTFKISLFGILA